MVPSRTPLSDNRPGQRQEGGLEPERTHETQAGLAKTGLAQTGLAQTGLAERLRRETRQAHERLEGTLDLLDPALTLDAYRDLVARFHGFWRVWEPAVAAALAEPDLFDPCRRAHLLVRDLEALGLDAREIAALPACPQLPPLGDAVEALGSLYVMEGSTLGGRVILKALERHLGLSAARGAAYFAGCGDEPAAQWRRFRTRLDARAAQWQDPDDAARCVAAADKTFDILTSWLPAPPAPPPDTLPRSEARA